MQTVTSSLELFANGKNIVDREKPIGKQLRSEVWGSFQELAGYSELYADGLRNMICGGADIDHELLRCSVPLRLSARLVRVLC